MARGPARCNNAFSVSRRFRRYPRCSASSLIHNALVMPSTGATRAAGSGLVKALDSVGAKRAHGATLGLEKVQVSERLADGEAQLVRVELAAEQDRDQLGARLGLDERVGGFGQPGVVMLHECR